MSAAGCHHGIVGACSKCQADARLTLANTLAERVKSLNAELAAERARTGGAPTITTVGAHGFEAGDIITITGLRDRRAWRRLLHWVLRRDPPTITRRARVSASAPSTLFLDTETPR